jgi:hypothetical protein
MLMPRRPAPALRVPTLTHGDHLLTCSGPGVFIVRPDGTLYRGAAQTTPFARPHFDELLSAIDFALAKNHPTRGDYAGAL